MSEDVADRPGLFGLGRKLGSTFLGAVRNRGELFAVEWQLEKARMTDLLISTLGVLFLGFLGLVMLTGTILFLVPDKYRVYAAGGFAFLFLIGAFSAWVWAKSLLRQEPFSESLKQLQKDGLWVDSSR